MNHIFRYEGCFFSSNELYSEPFVASQKRLSRIIKAPHITFAYKPNITNTVLFGEPITVRAIAYGNDGFNEGLLVELVSASPTISELFEKIDIPHITLSVSKNAQPVNTRLLEFKPIEPFEIQGIYGGYSQDEQVITKS